MKDCLRNWVTRRSMYTQMGEEGENYPDSERLFPNKLMILVLKIHVRPWQMVSATE